MLQIKGGLQENLKDLMNKFFIICMGWVNYENERCCCGTVYCTVKLKLCPTFVNNFDKMVNYYNF